MINKILIDCNIKKLKIFAKFLSKNINPSDVILLSGELGSGKTTFARYLILYLYELYKLSPPEFIKSPTYPIMISYKLKKFDLLHYDLYRLNDIKEIRELDIIDNLNSNITLIEWPEIILDQLKKRNHFLIKFNIIKNDIRRLNVSHN